MLMYTGPAYPPWSSLTPQCCRWIQRPVPSDLLSLRASKWCPLGLLGRAVPSCEAPWSQVLLLPPAVQQVIACRHVKLWLQDQGHQSLWTWGSQGGQQGDVIRLCLTGPSTTSSLADSAILPTAALHCNICSLATCYGIHMRAQHGSSKMVWHGFAGQQGPKCKPHKPGQDAQEQADLNCWICNRLLTTRSNSASYDACAAL